MNYDSLFQVFKKKKKTLLDFSRSLYLEFRCSKVSFFFFPQLASFISLLLLPWDYFTLVFLVPCRSGFPLILEFLNFSVVKCVYPAIEHGTIVSGFGPKYYYKATVVLKCNEGFNLYGNSVVVCGENSTWEPELPKCIKGKSTIFLLFLFFMSFTLNISDARKTEEKQCSYLTVLYSFL